MIKGEKNDCEWEEVGEIIRVKNKNKVKKGRK